ncbi:MAG: 16S rRNA (cytosine(967)-C(5))-methyltransferase RsmB [Acidobacteria bacterium]|nr:16S rRNA (cytosine(967)-C(5))-methyltransferase RsmB [Acidobacteriota bacterium]
MIAPARRAAYDVLRAVSMGALDLPAALAASRDHLRDPRDRALTGEIAVGVLRWRGAIDAIAARLVRRPLAKVDPEVVDILRIGIYQLWHLQRVPPSAVVNDAVQLTRVARRGRASALVNAALRAFGRSDPTTLLPARPVDSGAATGPALDYLSVALSHPRWLASRWLARHGFDATERWLRFNNSAAPLTLRVNTLKSAAHAAAAGMDAEGITTEAARRAPDALVVRDGNPLLSSRFAAGEFIVQDEASQLVALMAGARPGERVLDACASPGGKSVVMACESDGRAQIVAADVRDKRIALLRETFRRTGVHAHVLQLDLRGPAPFGANFDCVLVDAPCSGLGTVRRDPDIKWRREEADLPALAGVQVRLLRHAAAAVRPGGRLVYATCSSEPEENDGVVETFLQQPEGFTPAARAELAGLPRWPVLAGVCDDLGRLRTLPHVHGLEAFFAAVLVKGNAL